MLFDPKWEAKTKEPSLAGFIAWLETQDPVAEYPWTSCFGKCAVSEYFVHVSGSVDKHYDLWGTHLSTDLDMLAHQSPWTYGALLERARAA